MRLRELPVDVPAAVMADVRLAEFMVEVPVLLRFVAVVVALVPVPRVLP